MNLKAAGLQLFEKENPILVFSSFLGTFFRTALLLANSLCHSRRHLLNLIKAYPLDFGLESTNMQHMCKAFCKLRNLAEVSASQSIYSWRCNTKEKTKTLYKFFSHFIPFVLNKFFYGYSLSLKA